MWRRGSLRPRLYQPLVAFYALQATRIPRTDLIKTSTPFNIVQIRLHDSEQTVIMFNGPETINEAILISIFSIADGATICSLVLSMHLISLPTPNFHPIPVSSSVLPEVFTPGEIHPPLQIVLKSEKVYSEKQKEAFAQNSCPPAQSPQGRLDPRSCAPDSMQGVCSENIHANACRGYRPGFQHREIHCLKETRNPDVQRLEPKLFVA